jgi:hypothetical protein
MPHSKSSDISIYTLRYSVPGRYDIASFGTIYRVQAGEEETTEMYVQLGDDSNVPNWQRMGTLMELAFKELLEDPEFISECLRLYRATTKEYDQNILHKMMKK